MKKFKFQLETLLKVTRMKKDDAEVRFAEVSRRLEDQRYHLQLLLEEMQKGQREYEELSKEGKRVTIGRIMIFNSFFAWKREQIEMQQNLILQTREEKQKRLKELMDIMSYLKSIEQLKTKRFEEYTAELLAEEQKMLDEIGLQLYMRSETRENSSR